MTVQRAIVDLLYPGLRYETGNTKPGTETQLIAREDGGIDVRVNDSRSSLISRQEISDGSYKRLFKPRVDAALSKVRA